AARAENEMRQAKKKELLAAYGLPEDYTAPRYDCAACQDTGYTERGMCACMKRLLTLEGFASSGLGVLLEKQSFESFTLSYY
ncbi:MAG: DNA replication protein DnaC, partial [Clostridia bacterium]|nr:DNA replication protein DnaC [Clostridia bacterium]